MLDVENATAYLRDRGLIGQTLFEDGTLTVRSAARRNRNLRVEVMETTGLIGVLRFNQLYPPFDNPAIRRAALRAVNQKEFMTAVAGEAGPDVINDHVGFFAPSSAYASEAGMENFSPNPNFAALRKEVMAAGYNGEKVVFLGAADVPRITAICEVGADVLSKIGLNVDYQSMDWGSVVTRRANQNPVDQGGWGAFVTVMSPLTAANPGSMLPLRGNGRKGWFGWPTDERLEQLREAWFDAPDLAAQKAISEQVQLRYFDTVPFLVLCRMLQPMAFRSDIKDVVAASFPVFWGARRA